MRNTFNKFTRLDTWKSIIESRIIYYKNKGKPWYKSRNEICNPCEHNSGNSEVKTITDKIWSLLNLKQPYCKVCKCTLKYKTAMPNSVCGLEEIDEKPKWIEHYGS